VEIDTSNFILGRPSPRMTNRPWKGRGQVAWSIFEIFGP